MELKRVKKRERSLRPFLASDCFVVVVAASSFFIGGGGGSWLCRSFHSKPWGEAAATAESTALKHCIVLADPGPLASAQLRITVVITPKYLQHAPGAGAGQLLPPVGHNPLAPPPPCWFLQLAPSRGPTRVEAARHQHRDHHHHQHGLVRAPRRASRPSSGLRLTCSMSTYVGTHTICMTPSCPSYTRYGV